MRRRAIMSDSGGGWRTWCYCPLHGSLLDTSGNGNNVILAGNAVIRPTYLDTNTTGWGRIAITQLFNYDFQVDFDLYINAAVKLYRMIWCNGESNSGLFLGTASFGYVLNGGTFLFNIPLDMSTVLTVGSNLHVTIIGSNKIGFSTFSAHIIDKNTGNTRYQVSTNAIIPSGNQSTGDIYIGNGDKQITTALSPLYIQELNILVK